MRGGESKPSASGLRTSSATSTVTRNAETNTPPAATPPPDANAQLVSQVSAALESVGLSPAEFNLRVGAMEIVFPGRPTYDYPVLWANIQGKETAFYLQGAMQNPGMVAINISGMMGRPVMHLI